MKLEKIDLIKEERKEMNKAEINNAIYNFTSTIAEEMGIKNDIKMFVKLLDSFHNDFIYKDKKVVYTEKNFFEDDLNLEYLFMNENCDNIIIKCTYQHEVIYGKLQNFNPITILERFSSRQEVIDYTGINSDDLDILIEDCMNCFGIQEVEDEMDQPKVMIDLNDKYEFGITEMMYDNDDVQDCFYWIRAKESVD